MARKRDDNGVPACPRHPKGWVVRNGMYGSGGSRRQRWRCTPDEDSGDPPHNFTGPVVRTVLDHESTCESCEQPLARHQGPGVARRYQFPVLEVALALVRVGREMTYSEAARRAQVRTARGSRPTAQLVGNWVEVFGPVVAADRAETFWPETVVLDSKPLTANLSGGARGTAFTVLVAWGYEAGEAKGRLMAVRAVPASATGEKWEDFLKTLQGAPVMVITDDDDTTIAGVRAAFPNAVIRLCRWHLKLNLSKTLRSTVGTKPGHPLNIKAKTALDTAADWEEFKEAAADYNRELLDKFVERAEKRLPDEFAADQATPGGLPDHWSNGAAELALRHITDRIKRRAFTLRNAERTNRLLELMRLHENRWDDLGTYSAAIREHLHKVGKPARQLSIKDPTGQSSLR